MVKPGYKRTQSGVIPEEWDEALLGEKADIYRGGSPRPIQSYITQSGSGVNWIKIGDVGAGEKYITKTAEKITPEGAARSRKVYAGDLILSNSMSFGRPYVLALDGCIHDGWLVIQNYHDTFCQDFLYYLLSSDFVYQQYAFMAAGSSVQNLNKGKVEALRVVIPPLPEQERIAGALSDADRLISALERLIAKKRDIRQGAVTRLLTGETRLPGFCGTWKDGRIGDIAQPVRGQMLRSTDCVPGPYPVIAGGKSPAGYHNVCNRTGVTITISASGANAGYVALHRTPIFASDCSTISESADYCVEYVYLLAAKYARGHLQGPDRRRAAPHPSGRYHAPQGALPCGHRRAGGNRRPALRHGPGDRRAGARAGQGPPGPAGHDAAAFNGKH